MAPIYYLRVVCNVCIVQRDYKGHYGVTVGTDPGVGQGPGSP